MTNDEIADYLCDLAEQTRDRGNFAVSALILDETGHLVIDAVNTIFENIFHKSSEHAEMNVIDYVEQFHSDLDRSKLTLITSVECCPMCLTRAIMSGIGKVYYLAPDPAAGMINTREFLPKVFQDLSKSMIFGQFECSEEYIERATRLFRSNVVELDKKLSH